MNAAEKDRLSFGLIGVGFCLRRDVRKEAT